MPALLPSFLRNLCQRLLLTNIGHVAHYPRLVNTYCGLNDTGNAKIWANRMALTLIVIYGGELGVL